MEAELESLEGKVAQFVAVCERLRAENQALKAELASVRGEAQRLNDKVDGARGRLERLLTRLPEQ